jgi:hypothetical protein
MKSVKFLGKLATNYGGTKFQRDKVAKRFAKVYFGAL